MRVPSKSNFNTNNDEKSSVNYYYYYCYWYCEREARGTFKKKNDIMTRRKDNTIISKNSLDFSCIYVRVSLS